MDYEVVIPEEPTEELPKGAAILRTRTHYGFIAHDPRERFGEACAQAARQHRLVKLPASVKTIGHYNETDGELRVMQGRIQLLEAWIGRRMSRDELEARENRSTRRNQARRLLRQGRIAEAWMIDRRLGL